MLRIMFNRTYATGAHVVSMLRDNPSGCPVQVIGTHADLDSPVLAACDEAYPEPPEDVIGADYVAWALAFTAEHRIDVLVPRLNSADLADAREDFAAAGVALVAPPGDAIRLFHDKAAAYADAAPRGLAVPPYRVVTTSAELRAAVADLTPVSAQLCIKPVSGVAGAGYRRLTTEAPTMADLLGHLDPFETVERYCAALDASTADDQPALPPLMVLPYLTGPEVTVDCLGDPDGGLLAAVGRTKGRRRRRIVDDGPSREVARELLAAHRMSFLSNVQVRYWQGPDDEQPLPYLLEVNTRMSGGLFMTALTGLNLPWAAVQLALGQDLHLPTPEFDISFTPVSSIVRLP